LRAKLERILQTKKWSLDRIEKAEATAASTKKIIQGTRRVWTQPICLIPSIVEKVNESPAAVDAVASKQAPK
jgi:hypothetical protein